MSRILPHRRFSLFLLLLIGPVQLAGQAQTLRIYHIDVEQASATLFVTPVGKSLLVDSGKNGHGPRIRSIMQQAGVSRIDHFVLTHYHEDHYGGIDELAAEVTVDKAYDRGDKQFLPTSKVDDSSYVNYQDAVGHRAVHLVRGETIAVDSLVTATCIASGGAVLGEPDNHVTGNDENDMSVALLVQFRGFRYFIGGDIEDSTESDIARVDAVTDVDVYVANHHGSHTSSSSEFMLDLRPVVIIISNGNNGLYKHPRQSTLSFFAAMNPEPIVLQTNKFLKGQPGGNVANRFIADLESSDTDGTILFTVHPDSAKYTASYRDTSITVPIKHPVIPVVVSAGVKFVIESLLPNPAGDDRLLEEVTIRNSGALPVSMAGWFLQDEEGRVWSLATLKTIGAGMSKKIRRNAMAMTLNNDADEIILFDDKRIERDRFRYDGSQVGLRIVTGH